MTSLGRLCRGSFWKHAGTQPLLPVTAGCSDSDPGHLVMQGRGTMEEAGLCWACRGGAVQVPWTQVWGGWPMGDQGPPVPMVLCAGPLWRRDVCVPHLLVGFSLSPVAAEHEKPRAGGRITRRARAVGEVGCSAVSRAITVTPWDLFTCALSAQKDLASVDAHLPLL